MAAEELTGLLFDPGVTAGRCFAEETVGCGPQVFGGMDEIQDQDEARQVCLDPLLQGRTPVGQSNPLLDVASLPLLGLVRQPLQGRIFAV